MSGRTIRGRRRRCCGETDGGLHRSLPIAGTGPAPNGDVMVIDAASTGLIAILNGLLDLFGMVFSLRTLLVVFLIVGLAFCALCEVEELDRQSVKPTIRRH